MTLAELLANATPGPWRLSFGRFPKQVRDDESAFATVSGPPPTDDTPGAHVIRQPVHLGDSRAKPDHWEADARLIALAPDLARLALDMGEALRKHHDWMRVERRNTLTAREADALLARLERITDSRNGLTSGESLDGIADKNATQ